MKNSYKIALALLLTPLVLVGRPAKALTIVPPSLEYTANPGDVIPATIKLFNGSQTVETVYASVSNFTAKGEQGEPDFDLTSTPTDIATWIDYPKGPLTIQPNDNLRIPVSITIPKNAEPGGHYAAVFFGNDPSKNNENGGQVAIRSLLGSLVIVRVAGDVREAASVSSFETSNKKTSTDSLPATFDLRIKNTGNVHIRPQGTIVIKNMFGGETARIAVNEVNGAVLPNSIRDFAVTWTKNGKTGKGFFGKVSQQWNNFALGSYTATATVNYGDAKQSLVSTAHLTVFPWQLLIVLLIVLAVIFFIFFVGLKQYNAAIIRNATRSSANRK